MSGHWGDGEPKKSYNTSMFDVVPPNAEEFDREVGLSPSRRRGVVRGKARPAGWRSRKYGAEGDLGKKTVQVEWKLPARLRKPVREQLKKERAERSRRQAVIKFDRRPIRTRVVARSSSFDSEDKENRGAEKHMGDTYRHSKPNVQVAVPPYKGKAVSRRPLKKSAGMKTDAMRQRPRMQQRVPKKVAVASGASSGVSSWTAGERDVPYDWRGQGGGKVKKTEKLEIGLDDRQDEGLSLPFSFSLWPRSWGWGKNGDTGKKKLTTPVRSANLLILLVGLGVSWGVIWNLQGAGRGWAVLGAVQSQAEEAVGRVLAAQSALAEADLEGGEQSLAEAEQLLTAAKTDMDEALQASRVVLKYVDVTGRVRSGDALLTAGQELTGAGKRIAQGLQHLEGSEAAVAGELLGDAKVEEEQSLVDGILLAQDEFEAALGQVIIANEALQDVTVSRLPDDVRPAVEQMMVLVPRIEEVLTAITEQSDSILYLLGASQDRQYLLAFANNHELRPVGGFIGTVGLVNMDRGRVEHIDIGSVYHHDGQLRDFIAPPEPLQKIVDRWYMRDTNWFVNYPVSARKMAEFLEKEAGPTVDGVVLMTPAVIQRLLRLSGPLLVPGYDVVVSADNFVEVTQSQVTYEYDPELNRPKQFLADLTPLLLQRVLAASEEGEAGREVQLLATLTEAISEKELLMYFQDEQAQAGLAELGWDGSLPPEKPGLLAVNTANIGGHKSDQFIQQEIDYRSKIQESGEVEVTVTIRREHKGPTEGLNIEYPEGENPAEKENIVYQRVLVPMGAELLEASGFTRVSDIPQRVDVADDLPMRLDPEVVAWQDAQVEGANGTLVGQEAGYKFFANWMATAPGQTTVGLLRYRLPSADLPGWWDRASSYQAYVYKQPGDDRTTVRASIEVPEGYRMTHVVPDQGVTQEQRVVTYRGDLRRDIVLGAVIEPES